MKKALVLLAKSRPATSRRPTTCPTVHGPFFCPKERSKKRLWQRGQFLEKSEKMRKILGIPMSLLIFEVHLSSVYGFLGDVNDVCECLWELWLRVVWFLGTNIWKLWQAPVPQSWIQSLWQTSPAIEVTNTNAKCWILSWKPFWSPLTAWIDSLSKKCLSTSKKVIRRFSELRRPWPRLAKQAEPHGGWRRRPQGDSPFLKAQLQEWKTACNVMEDEIK